MSVARYAATQNNAASPREIELRAFRYVNGLLAAATDTPGRATALYKTTQLWSLLITDLVRVDNELPAELKGQLISLGLWAQREAAARLGDGGSLAALIALHRDMIAGLDSQHAAPLPAQRQPAFVAGTA